MIVVEVLGRRGEVVQQVRLATLPATIGRAWSSDVVVSDPMVDAQHARIAADEGGVHIEDLGSVNGLHLDATRHRVPRISLNGATSMRVGRTWLRITRADEAVPAAVPDLAPSGRLASVLASNQAMALVFGAGLLLAVVARWLAFYTPNPGLKIVEEVLLFAAAVAAWAGIWALIGRLRVQQFQFAQHHTVVWLAMIAMVLLGVVEGWADFFLPGMDLVQVAFLLMVAAIAILAVAGHLAMVSTARRSRRIALASGIVCGLLLLFGLSASVSEDEFSGSTVAITTSLKPVPEGMIPAMSINEFVTETDEVKKSVDEKARDN